MTKERLARLKALTQTLNKAFVELRALTQEEDAAVGGTINGVIQGSGGKLGRRKWRYAASRLRNAAAYSYNVELSLRYAIQRIEPDRRGEES